MGFRLVHLSGSLAGQARPLADGEEIVLGRDPAAAQVVFGPDDRVVSRRHASLRPEGDVLRLRDLDSSTGTFLDGESIEEAELQDGDVFELGPGGPRLRVATGDGGTMVVSGPVLQPAPQPTRTEPPPARLHPDARLSLAITSGARAGDVVEAGGRVIRLGRAPANTLAFASDLVVSAQHAKIVRLDDGFVLIDLESRNGTFVNGRRVARARLRHGDVVGLGAGGPEMRAEIRRRAEAGTVVIPNFAQLARRRTDGVLVREDEVPDAGLVIGRGERAGLRLESPIVSQAHARLVPQDAGLVIEDLQSANGTYVNGLAVQRRALAPGDRIVVGPFRLEVDGRRLKVLDTRRRADVRAESLVVEAGGRRVLGGVSLALPAGSFTAIIGPSGSGKSTLLKALCGARPADAGRVRVNGVDLYGAGSALAGTIGYVPQDDIVHRELTPVECLDYTARLRLPTDTTREERERRIADVLATLELTERRDVPIQRLSGGQRKRVSIAVELLTEPDVLFLDEPTSGLDPGLEESLMLLLRELSFKGKTVVIVTHTLDHLALCDGLLAVVGGRLVFDGRPDEALLRFGIAHAAQLYARLKEQPADDWAAAFEERERRATPPALLPDAASSASGRPLPAPPRTTGAARQLGVLAARYVKTLTRDRRNAALLLGQAPIVAGLIGLSMLYGAGDLAYTKPKNTLLFLLALIAVWFGASNAARELVKERAIAARERMVGLRGSSYVGSKLLVLSALALAQCLLAFAILGVWFGIPGDAPALIGGMWLAAITGLLLGLVVSAFARSTDRATTVLPIVLIPQVLFTFPAVQLDMKGPAGLAARAMPTWWSFDLLRRLALRPDERETDDAIDARLAAGRPALLTKPRFERMVRDGYSMWNYRNVVELTWTASGPERWAARLPARWDAARPIVVDVAALLAIAGLLWAIAVRRETIRGPSG